MEDAEDFGRGKGVSPQNNNYGANFQIGCILKLTGFEKEMRNILLSNNGGNKARFVELSKSKKGITGDILREKRLMGPQKIR